MKHYRTAPPHDRWEGRDLHPSTAIFETKAEADAHAKETRSYSAEGRSYDPVTKQYDTIWYVPK